MACSLFKCFREPKSKSTEIGGTYGMIEGEEKFVQVLVDKPDTDHLDKFRVRGS